jgi:hypothetical protein
MSEAQTRPSSSTRITARATAAFAVSLSFLVMLVSGVFLYVAPRGRDARALDWSLGGLSREGWETVHLSMSALFSVIAIWHLLIHWAIVKNLVVGIADYQHRHRMEALVAFVAVALLTVLAVLNLPPASWLVELNEFFKKEFWI